MNNETRVDAMREAVEALTEARHFMAAPGGSLGWEHPMVQRNVAAVESLQAALSILRSALEEGGEPTPVAWLFEGPGLRQLTKAGDFTKPVLDLHKRMALEQPNKYTLTPLYASPIAADTQGDAKCAVTHFNCHADCPQPCRVSGTDLHAAIMNLPSKWMPDDGDEQAYKRGHRDARHAAAELAVSSASPVLAPAVPATPGGGLSTDGVKEVPDADR